MQRDLKVIDQPGTKHWATFLFIHDKWQARSNITVDLGLRWEYYTPLRGLEGAGSLANYDPATNTLRVSGFGDTDEALNVKKTFRNFAPRTGVSWRVNDKTVLRAGYGAGTIPFPDNRYAFNFPVKQNYSGSAANGFQNAGSMAVGFPAPSLLTIPSSGIVPVSGSLLNSTFDVIPPDLREGTLHSWNVAFQRQLPFSLTADIAYVGNRGVDLVMDIDTNASLIYGSGNNGRPQFAQFNRTGNSRTRTNDNKSQYNALQMKVDRRFRNGLLITNWYTLSQSKDYVNENTTLGTPIDRELSWARSNFDRLHNYVLTTIYELPIGPGRKWLTDGLAGKIIGGWQVSGVYNLQSGVPLTIGGNGTLLNTPGNSAFANLNGEHKVLGGLGPGLLYFDPAVYSLPAANTQGNLSRNSGPDGPGYWNLDMSLFKRFGVGGARFAEVRVDAYNVTNDVRWGNPTHGIQHGGRQHVRPDHRSDGQSAERAVRRTVRVLRQEIRRSGDQEFSEREVAARRASIARRAAAGSPGRRQLRRDVPFGRGASEQTREARDVAGQTKIRLDLGSGIRRHAHAQADVVEQSFHGAGEPLGIVRRDQPAGPAILQDFRHADDRRGNHRQSHRHRFEHHRRHAVSPSTREDRVRQRHHRMTAHQREEPRVLDVALDAWSRSRRDRAPQSSP